MRCRAVFSVVAIAAILAIAESAAVAQEPQSADAPAYSRRGADTCIACHDDEATLSVFRTPHGVPTDAQSPFGPGQLQCEACHGPGDAHAARIRRGQERPPVVRFGAAAAPVRQQNEACLGCHDDRPGFGWHGGIHDNDEVPCASCHTVHLPSDPVRETRTQAEVCFECHTAQRTETRKAFSHPVFEGKMACSDCHSPHGDDAFSTLARQSINDTCYDCHAEKRGPFLWEHAPVSEDCTLCHSPHGSNHPGMLTARAPLLCQSCHSQAGHPSVAQDAEGLIGAAAPSQYLLGQSCLNCHSQIHGSNHPSGSRLMR